MSVKAEPAQSISSKITLTGIVPEMRFVYVSPDGLIYKVVGNTSNNIMPRAVGANNKEASMTDAIWQQYVYFMNQHNWHIDTGASYDVSPIELNSSASSALIQVNTQVQASGNSLSLQAGATPVSGQTG